MEFTSGPLVLDQGAHPVALFCPVSELAIGSPVSYLIYLQDSESRGFPRE